MTRALLPIASPRDARAEVLRGIRAQPRTAAVAGLVLLAASAAALVVPPLLGRIVDLALDDGTKAAVTTTVLALFAAIAVQALLTWVGGRLVARVGETILADLRERVVTRALALPASRLEGAGTGDLISRVSGDVAVVSEGIRTVVPELVRSGLFAALTVGGIAVIDWRLALVAALALPVQGAGLRWYLKHVVPVYRRQRVNEGERTHQLVAAVSGAKTARALGLGRARREHVRESSQTAADTAVRAARMISWSFLLTMNLGELVGLSAVLIVGFFLVESDAITVGAATAAALYFHRAFDPIGALLGLVDDVQEATTALARLVGVATLPAPAPVAIPPGDGAVRAGGVDFAYVPGTPVLDAVDLDVGAGERVAVIGTTGAGKTTLARIVAGLQPPDGGRVEVAGRPALVTQEVHVFAGTLAEDLRLAAPGATDADLHAALDRVGAMGWVDALPDGLATRVGEGGERLTATQAQQLALARLLLADPALAILDEATAEAGSHGARVLEAAADRVLEGRSSLVVAHRLTQAAAADRVVVLEAGQVVEEGAHAELVEAGGRYAELWSAWTAERTA